MTIRFEDSGPPVTAEVLDEFEATLTGRLPADYRRFLLTQNGGRAEPNWWPPEAGAADFKADEFYGLGDMGHNALPAVREVFRDRIPPHLVAIARDENGNQLCLSLDDSEHGRVWFFDHELELDPEYPPDSALLTHVTDSFTNLLEVLEPDPPYEEVLRRVRAVDQR